MKRITIGDPHGLWGFVKQIYNKEQPDEVIILGDYFDSFNIDVYTQRESYDNIIELRKEHLKKHEKGFHMLIGNHDMHYMDEKFGRCSGWNALSASIAGYPLVRDWDKEILQIVFIDEINKIIYSHAGVTMNWFQQHCKNIDDINTLSAEYLQFTYKNGGDYYGSSSWNSPLWVRPEGLVKSPYTEWNDGNAIIWSQVFGHTETEAPYHWADSSGEFWGIDCIYKNYLIEILDDNGKLIERKLGKIIS